MKLALALILSASPALAQTVTVKDSPASTALTNAAKDIPALKKAYDKLAKQLTDAQTKLSEELAQDSKYRGEMDHINALEKQLNDFGQKAQQDNTLITGLAAVVRQENGLPATTTFDPATATWKAGAK